VAELIEAAHANSIVALDVHNSAALDNAFRIPVDHLTALPMFADHFATSLGNVALAVASPDVGGIKRVQIFRELLQERVGHDVELVFIEKRRTGDVVSGGQLVGALAPGSTVVVLDDLCATGGTLVRAAQACRDAGAAAVHVAVTHAPLPAGLDRLLACDAISGIVVTDSVGSALRHPQSSTAGSKLRVLRVAPLLGEALRRMTGGEPLAPLLRAWPIPR
jgi:ribose-phosphate pyrophosphokinase